MRSNETLNTSDQTRSQTVHPTRLVRVVKEIEGKRQKIASGYCVGFKGVARRRSPADESVRCPSSLYMRPDLQSSTDFGSDVRPFRFGFLRNSPIDVPIGPFP